MKVQQVDLSDGECTVIEWFGENIPAPRAAIIFFPALGVNIQYYRSLGKAWSDLGYRVGCMEMRGMKRSSVKNIKRRNFGYYEALNIDIPTIIDLAMQKSGDLPLYLAGHSLGAQFALLYSARSAYPVAGIILLASGSNYYNSLPTWILRRKRQIGILTIRFITHFLGFFPGDRLGFGGRQPQNIMLDWTEEGLTGRYRVINDPLDYNAVIEAVDLPVLFVSMIGDKFVPRSCVDVLAKKLKCAQVTQVEVGIQNQDISIINHFSWVRQPHAVLDHVEQWMRQVI